MRAITAEHRLTPLLQARSIAIVGASERNHYAALAVANLKTLKYSGRLHMVNPRGGIIFGQQAVTSCADITEPVDTAYICVPIAGVIDAVAAAAAAGIRNFVVLTSGFAEVGGEGVQLQDRLVELCRQFDLGLLGPNCLGFVNFADAVSLGSIPVPPSQPAAALGIVSASGATAHQLAAYAQQLGIGVTHLIATGNEANITTADCLDYLVQHPAVKSIAVFLESIRDPENFIAVAQRALQMRKPIVVLKVGAAPTTAAVAAAHTGALVGDDKVFNAACERFGLVRVDTFERLITTAAALGNIGYLEKPGVACVSISGGACEVMSDLADAYGVPMPAFAPVTTQALGEVVSDLGQMHNPIDLTGAAVRDPSLWEKVLRIVSADPQVGLTLCNFDPPADAEQLQRTALAPIASGLRAATSKAALITSYIKPITDVGQAYLSDNQLPTALSGLGDGMFAAGKLVWWSERVRNYAPLQSTATTISSARPQSEQEALVYLRAAGVPVIPSIVTKTAAEAVAAARDFAGPVVLKIASPDIAHKTDIGGVLLNLRGDAEVEQGFNRIMNAAQAAHPEARIEGIAVSPMRDKGVELFVGIARDPQWGLVMALGLGGVWVEVMNDTRLCLLPVRKQDVVAAFNSLRAAKLLQGYRGSPVVDLDAVADVVVKIGAAALALGPQLAAFEINPLLVRGNQVEALDALPVWDKERSE
ncbi:MAG: acetate--CoA ligase family protein [Spongiibacteraceae bacterium]